MIYTQKETGNGQKETGNGPFCYQLGESGWGWHLIDFGSFLGFLFSRLPLVCSDRVKVQCVNIRKKPLRLFCFSLIAFLWIFTDTSLWGKSVDWQNSQLHGCWWCHFTSACLRLLQRGTPGRFLQLTVHCIRKQLETITDAALWKKKKTWVRTPLRNICSHLIDPRKCCSKHQTHTHSQAVGW